MALVTELVEPTAFDRASEMTGGGVLDLEQRLGGSAVLRYGFSVIGVAAALGVSLLFDAYGFRDVGLPLFTLAIALVTWYAGSGPSALAVVLSATAFNYFFTEPIHTLYVWAERDPLFCHFHSVGRDHRRLRRGPAARGARPSSGARPSPGRQQGIGIICLFRFPRSAGAVAPHGGISRARCNDRHRLRSTRRANGSYERSQTRRKGWVT